MTIVPIHQIRSRIREQGRIRMGEKNRGGFPTKLKRFRFTSPDREAIEAIAAKYGGTAAQWPGAPVGEQWQVTIRSKHVDILLPPDALGDSPIYELWSGGGCQRRCDGELCSIPSQQEPVSCMCAANEKMACKPITRLNVVLAGINFGGVWRLQSGGWNAAQEMPPMVDLILNLQERGLPRAILTVDERESKVEGKPNRKFVVPALALAEDLVALAEGRLSVGTLGHAPPPMALPAPLDEANEAEGEELLEESPGPTVDEADDAVIVDLDEFGLDEADAHSGIEDAVLVEDVSEDAGPGGPGASGRTSPPAAAEEIPSEGDAATSSEAPRGSRPLSPAERRDHLRRALHASLRAVTLLPTTPAVDVDTLRHGLALRISRGTTRSSNDLDNDMLSAAVDICKELEGGERKFLDPMFDAAGALRFTRKRQ